MKKYLGLLCAALIACTASAQNSINGHEYVDLGLSVKWATCNIGALSPSDHGAYFAWGEPRTKGKYTKENSQTYRQNIGDIGGTDRDAATVNWGNSWRLPTKAEFEELKELCTWIWTNEGGHNGCRVTGPNGNSIFLPASGYINGNLKHGRDFDSLCGYWSSTPSEETRDAVMICNYYGEDVLRISDSGDRYEGLPIRPVTETTETEQTQIATFEPALSTNTDSINGYGYVDLGLSVKWATCNIGATSPSDYGNYYAWGGTETKSEYTKENSAIKGLEIGNIGDISGTTRDAATVNWGSTWRMPTYAEIQEITVCCTWIWTNEDGHNGYRVTGPTGNSIFLPASGGREGSSSFVVGEIGLYRSSSPESYYSDGTQIFTGDVSGIFFNNSDRNWADGIDHYIGGVVRPVTE